MLRLQCFACGRPLGRTPLLVTCEDEQDVFVGSGCGKEVIIAGPWGWQPPKGGPRLFALAYDPKPIKRTVGERLDAAKRAASAPKTEPAT